MTTYPIHPRLRLLRRLKTLFTSMMDGQDAFTGVTLRDDFSDLDNMLPVIVLQAGESEEKPLRGNAWHLKVTIMLLEERVEGNTILANGDSRTRHEWRHENISARLFGMWNGSRLPAALNAIVETQGMHVFKMYANSVIHEGNSTEDMLGTAYIFTGVCASTTQD
jgi:hypothetical protein